MANSNQNFQATLTAWAKKSKLRMLTVVQMSTQDVINDANTPTAQGGNMHVDTGFLRASGQLSYTGMPSGPIRGEKDQTYQPNNTIIAVEIAKMKIGDTLFFGWTANYALIRENKDAFLRLAVQKWPTVVARNCAIVKARIDP